jgi:hypothetical protein
MILGNEINLHILLAASVLRFPPAITGLSSTAFKNISGEFTVSGFNLD